MLSLYPKRGRGGRGVRGGGGRREGGRGKRRRESALVWRLRSARTGYPHTCLCIEAGEPSPSGRQSTGYL